MKKAKKIIEEVKKRIDGDIEILDWSVLVDDLVIWTDNPDYYEIIVEDDNLIIWSDSDNMWWNIKDWRDKN